MKTENLVVVRRNPDAYAGTRAVLARLDIRGLENNKILLKPNLGRLFNTRTGVVTNTEVIAAVIDDFQERGFRNLFLGDSPIIGLKAADIYKKTGVDELAKQKGVTLLDFDEEKPSTIEIPAGRVIKQVNVYRHLREYDYIVSIPVIKTHMHTSVTLALKNMKGCLWRHEKVRLHQLQFTEENNLPGEKELDAAIADLSLCLKPDLAIIDGSICLEGMGPSAGSKREFNTIIGSRNYLYADAIAGRLIGFELDAIAHLRLAFAYHQFEFGDIAVDPHDYLSLAEKFAPAPEKISIEFPGVEVHDHQSCSACLSTLLVFLKEYCGEIKMDKLAGGKLKIRIGKGEVAYDGEALLLGNCTRRYKDAGGVYVPGCPPVSSTIFRLLKENGLLDGDFENI